MARVKITGDHYVLGWIRAQGVMALVDAWLQIRGFNQAELARRTQMPTSYFTDWRTGKRSEAAEDRPMNREHLRRMCNALRLREGQLLRGAFPEIRLPKDSQAAPPSRPVADQ